VACRETDGLIEAYGDGQLDLKSSLEVERHLASCASCAAALGSHRTLKSAIAGASLYHVAPPHLAARVRSAVRALEKEAAPGRAPRWRLLVFAAPVAALLILAWALPALWRAPSAADLLNEEVVSAHVRSLMGSHLTDFPSSDQHTVKPSFNGRVDFSPDVRDLSGSGFTLIGGRLEYVDRKPAAALVYQRRRHLINLFIWPATDEGEGTGDTEAALRGYNVVRWTRSGMDYSAVSDLNPAELREFREAWRE